MRNITSSVILSLLFAAPSIKALDNGLGLKPQMGWNSWNQFACDISEQTIKQAADQIITLGLDKLGYNYVNIDDCWMTADRTADGHYQADPVTFPNGMKAVGDYIHSLGLKFGIYTSAGTMTCQQRAGSLNHEMVDAQDFADWGVDYLKYDNCYNEGVPATTRYTAMRDALNATGRPIFYSICSWGEENVAVWGNVTGNSWRTTGDINASWKSMKQNILINDEHPASAGPGSWNDPDMLEIGVTAGDGLSHIEEETHFALWAITKSPLIIGADLSTISAESLAILQNEYLIKVNQDSLGNQGACILDCDGDISLWKSFQIDDGAYYSLLAINWHNTQAQSIDIDFAAAGVAVGATDLCTVHDLWTNEKLGDFQGTYSVKDVAPHSHKFLRVSCEYAQENSTFLQE